MLWTLLAHWSANGTLYWRSDWRLDETVHLLIEVHIESGPLLRGANLLLLHLGRWWRRWRHYLLLPGRLIGGRLDGKRERDVLSIRPGSEVVREFKVDPTLPDGLKLD